jgi:hypothetical protein
LRPIFRPGEINLGKNAEAERVDARRLCQDARLRAGAGRHQLEIADDGGDDEDRAGQNATRTNRITPVVTPVVYAPISGILTCSVRFFVQSA